MTNSSTAQRISGPGDLLQAIPYLLGFYPRRSLVLVGLANGVLVVTARLDLVDAQHQDVIDQTVSAMSGGGSSSLVAAVYDDAPAAQSPPVGSPDLRSAWADLAVAAERAAEAAQCLVMDVLLVAADRWWSFSCGSPGCCPLEGRPMPEEPSAFAAAATYAGVVALPDRHALEAMFEPLPETERDRLVPAMGQAEDATVAAVLDSHARRHERSLKPTIFAAARAADEPGWPGLADAEAARFAAALADIRMRDAVWMAIDDGRIDGRPLWLALARRLPAPYDAPPAFLFGWAAWRAGDGALAGIAADRAITSDPAYSAADLLLAALSRGIDPRRMPKLRLPRSA